MYLHLHLNYIGVQVADVHGTQNKLLPKPETRKISIFFLTCCTVLFEESCSLFKINGFFFSIRRLHVNYTAATAYCNLLGITVFSIWKFSFSWLRHWLFYRTEHIIGDHIKKRPLYCKVLEIFG